MALDAREPVLRELAAALKAIDPRSVEQLEQMILTSNVVFCHGLGRSGFSSKAFAMRLMHLGVDCGIIGDVLAQPIHAGDLLVLTTASGGSSALKLYADKAKQLGAKIGLVTANINSPLAQLADAVVVIPAATKDQTGANRSSMLPMGSLFEEASYLLYDMITVDLMTLMGLTNDDMVKRHANLE